MRTQEMEKLEVKKSVEKMRLSGKLGKKPEIGSII
jgi:hypothetical protein